jgi:hypothetical protein
MPDKSASAYPVCSVKNRAWRRRSSAVRFALERQERPAGGPRPCDGGCSGTQLLGDSHFVRYQEGNPCLRITSINTVSPLTQA